MLTLLWLAIKVRSLQFGLEISGTVISILGNNLHIATTTIGRQFGIIEKVWSQTELDLNLGFVTY